MRTPATTLPAEPTVFLVDDNEALVRNLRWLIESVRLKVQTYAHAQAFLDDFDAQRPGCLLLDVRMPGISGLDLQQRLAVHRPHLPILFISGHGDIRMATHALRCGAFDFIEKPLNEQHLLDRIHSALLLDAAQCERQTQRQRLQLLFDSLTAREREVMELIVRGQSNKAIANGLGLSAKTVEVHRASMMAKLRAHSVADVVRMAVQHQQFASPPAPGWSPA